MSKMDDWAHLSLAKNIPLSTLSQADATADTNSETDHLLTSDLDSRFDDAIHAADDEGSDLRGAHRSEPGPAVFPLVETQSKRTRSWAPYEDSLLECPSIASLHRMFVGENSSAPLRSAYALRWLVVNPFQITFSCKWGHVTVGELLFVLPGLILIAFIAVHRMGSVEGSGSLASLSLAGSFATASRNSVWSFALGIPFDRALRYHKLLGMIGIILGILHAHAGYYEPEDSKRCRPFPSWPPCREFPGGGQYMSGFVMLVSMAMLGSTALNPIRRHMFEIFYVCHMGLVIAVLVAGFLHGGLMLVGVGMYAVDVACRAIMVFFTNPQKCKVTLLDDNIVRLEFHSPLLHKPGQYVFIAIPAVSMWQFHPFSIASAPDDSNTVLYIRALGNWTNRLREICQKTDTLVVHIDGPYGSPEIDIEGPRFEHFLLISAGIGATPMMSTASGLIHEHNRGRPISIIKFVWSGKSTKTLNALFLNGQDNETAFGKQVRASLRNESEEAQTDRQTFTKWDHSPMTNIKFQLHVTRPVYGEPRHSSVCTGRLDLEQIFTDFCVEVAPTPELVAAAPTKVAVMYCGPAGLGDTVRRMCKRHWASGAVRFYLHRESFEM